MPKLRKNNLVKRSPVLRGELLWRALGYESERTFQRAKAAGKIGVPLYPIHGHPTGVYALRADVERFRAKNSNEVSEGKSKEGSDMS